MSALEQFMIEDLAASRPRGMQPLLEPISERFGDALLGILLYGSCRRHTQIDEGLVDLLVIVSGYRRAYGSGVSAILNRLLPPNVYYLEANSPDGTLRSKYAVISLAQFRRRCTHPLDLYFWARFSQPCRLVLAHREGLTETLAEARASAVRHFARRVAPLAEAGKGPLDFWTRALASTYRCELRPEPPDAARRLVEADADYWQRLSAALDGAASEERSADRGSPNRLRQLRAHAEWLVRRLTGKAYNLARLFKAAGTFSNGIDYIVWKVERHSGVRVEPTERMRRYPRLAAWGLAWRMWRRGGFR